MRRTYIYCCVTLAILLTAACASQTPEQRAAEEQKKQEEKAAAATDECLDNPELAKHWGDCNVKAVLFEGRDALAKCQNLKTNAKNPLLLKIKVGSKGTVKMVHTTDDLQAGALGKCLRKEIQKFRFAAPPKGTEPLITVPYQFPI